MKLKYLLIKIFFLPALTILVSGCINYKDAGKQNVSYLYSNTDILLQPVYQVFHTSLDSSVLYFEINTSELLYARDGLMNDFISRFSIKYELLSNFDSRQLIDSMTSFFTDTVKETKRILISDSINMKVSSGHNYVLRLTATDLNRNKSYVSLLGVYKENKRSHQYFKLHNENGQILFDRVLSSKQGVRIFFKNDSIPVLYVKFYKNKFPIATPPFHVQSGKQVTIYPDSIFTLALNNNSTPLFTFPDVGIYRIMADTNFKESFSVFRFYDGFPDITMPEVMLHSARYLTTRQEYDNMVLMADKKQAIDEFWLNIAGNPDRARQLIKTYYNRVKLANNFFTSYHEGWKTDRGMIYIIYGPPSNVFKTTTSENWIYGDASNFKSLNFMFYKVENPFTDNDYMLSKSEMYRDSWYYAVSNWRR